jgi:hypothetical protein
MPITTTPSGGPQGEFSTYTPIYAQTLSATASTITLSNIPTTYTDLVLVCNLFSSGTTYSGIRFNGDTGSNYSLTDLYGDGTSAVSSRQSNITGGGSSTTSGTGGNTLTYQINNYSNSSTFKTAIGRNSNANTDAVVALSASTWRNTTPINSITLYTGTADSWSIGSTLTLYGIKAAAPAPKATGGDVITTDGTYWYHAFLSSGSFILGSASSLTCDYLVVAGGGGGGNRRSGGGGAGGVRAITGQTVSSTTTVTVGGGSYSGSIFADGALQGSPSSFGSYATSGGGNGSGMSYLNTTGGGAGGSGGGVRNAAGGAGNQGGYSPVEGYAGGTGDSGSPGNASGGGGAGGVGANSSGTSNGGPGTNTYNSINFSTWLTATNTGSGGYVGGGGGGGKTAGTSSGGVGGGGGGVSSGTGVSGTANTGGGGGGGIIDTFGGGFGGSGLVIVRYAV